MGKASNSWAEKQAYHFRVLHSNDDSIGLDSTLVEFINSLIQQQRLETAKHHRQTAG